MLITSNQLYCLWFKISNGTFSWIHIQYYRGCCPYIQYIFECIKAAVLLTLGDWLASPNRTGINVICWNAFWLEVTASEWQRTRFGPAHMCPWVFSAWCWWTRTCRVKGLSYKSGTITLEVKTCMMPLTGKEEQGRRKGGLKRKRKGGRWVCRSYLKQVAWPAFLNVFSDQIILWLQCIVLNHLVFFLKSVLHHWLVNNNNSPVMFAFKMIALKACIHVAINQNI